MLSEGFVMLVIISPHRHTARMVFLHQWLQRYMYRTDISWWIFLIAGMERYFAWLGS
jgi:hypothetical protein